MNTSNRMSLVSVLLILAGCGAKQPAEPSVEPVVEKPAETSSEAPNEPSDEVQPEHKSKWSADAELKMMCEELPCRKHVRIRLQREDGSFFEFFPELYPPIVQGSLITLLPGESVHLEVEVQGNELVNPRVVKEVKNPDRTIDFQFWKTPGGGVPTPMMLIVANPFDKFIRYRLGMMVPDSEEAYATSSCPVRPKGKVYENWPHPIYQLLIADMILVDETTDDLICK